MPHLTTADRLRDILDLYPLLPLLRTSRPPGDSESRRPAPGSRPPERLEVLQALDDRVRTRGDAVHVLAAEREGAEARQGCLGDLWLWVPSIYYRAYGVTDVPALPGRTLAQIVAWLLHMLPWVETQPWHAEFDADVRRWHSRLRHLAGEHDPAQPTHSGAGGCGWPIEPRDDGTWHVCTGCGRVFDHAAELARLAELQAPVTLRQGAELVGVSFRTLERRRDEGVLVPVREGRPARYALADIRRAVALPDGEVSA